MWSSSLKFFEENQFYGIKKRKIYFSYSVTKVV